MALIDVSLVTSSIIKLLSDAFSLPASGWQGTLISTGADSPPIIQAPAISPDPPAKVTDGLSFYLYHVQQNPQFKNTVPKGNDASPVKYTPLALNLFYILSANSSSEPAAPVEQLMMGIAMKALHDFPVVNDVTHVKSDSTDLVMNAALIGANNHFRISLQPIPFNEAVHYWTAGQSPLKLSAYYEISVVCLEPQESQSIAGRVLTYGTYVFPEGAPKITASRNTISFPVPFIAKPQKIDLQPAQVTPGGQLDFLGSGFLGEDIQLQIFNSASAATIIIKRSDTAWGLTTTDTTVLSITIPMPTEYYMAPGTYTAQICTTVTLKVSGGGTKTLNNVSNQFPFTVTPLINAQPYNAITNSIIINSTQVANAVNAIQPPVQVDSVVQVYVGGQRIVYKTQSVPQPGQFDVDVPGNTMTICLFANQAPASGSTPAAPLPLRILVSGAESAPQWITFNTL